MMSILSDTLYVQNIHEYVHDEGQIVTYKWLSRNLNVPANAAKQMLYAYVEWFRSPENSDPAADVSVIYTVSGVTYHQDDKDQRQKAWQVHLVEEDQLEATKAQLDSMLGVHVYSVQKGSLKDCSILYASNVSMNAAHLEDYGRWNGIDCDIGQVATRGRGPANDDHHKQLPRLSHHATAVGVKEEGHHRPATANDDHLKKLPQLSHHATAAAAAAGGKEEHGEFKSTVKPEKAFVDSKKVHKQKGSGKGTVASLFGKQGSPTSRKESGSAPVKIESVASKKKPVISSPFGISSPAKRSSPQKSPMKQSPVKPIPQESDCKVGTVSGTFEGLHGSDIEEDDSEEEISSSKQQRKESTQSSSMPSAKPAKTRTGGAKGAAGRERGVKTAAGQGRPKKRKRVQELSSDEEEAERGEASPPLAPPLAVTPEGRSSSTYPVAQRRRKRTKKLVSRTYVDEEGCMVTEKAWESASTDASDEEEGRKEGLAASPLKVKVEAADSPGKSGKAAKQASLMSFFKK